MDKLKAPGEDFGCPLRPLDLEQASKRLCPERRTHTSCRVALWFLTKCISWYTNDSSILCFQAVIASLSAKITLYSVKSLEKLR